MLAEFKQHQPELLNRKNKKVKVPKYNMIGPFTIYAKKR